MTENKITNQIIGTSFEIHRELGPGILETVYETVLFRKLSDMGLHIERQVPVSIRFQ